MRQLLVYAFDPDSRFEGRLVGALERMESGGTLRIIETWFAGRDATGELMAVSMRSRGAGSTVAPLLDFRLDPSKRRKTTAKADPAVLELGARLSPGEAIVAILVDHVWARTLEDAVAQSGGSRLSNELVDADTLGDLGPDLVGGARYRT